MPIRSTYPGHTSAGQFLGIVRQNQNSVSVPPSVKSNSTNRLFPAGIKVSHSERSKSLEENTRPWNISTHIERDTPMTGVKAPPSPPSKSDAIKKGKRRDRLKTADEKRSELKSKNVHFPISKKMNSTVYFESSERNNAALTRKIEYHPINSFLPVSSHPLTEFSTRWPPTPIRATCLGQTTAGRQLPGSRYDFGIPFYNRPPAGLPTVHNGTVDECMHWDYSVVSVGSNKTPAREEIRHDNTLNKQERMRQVG